MKYCPRCQKGKFTLYDYCYDCGSLLEITYEAECIKCLRKVTTATKFCAHCGGVMMEIDKED